jgi:hypothetical protein
VLLLAGVNDVGNYKHHTHIFPGLMHMYEVRAQHTVRHSAAAASQVPRRMLPCRKAAGAAACPWLAEGCRGGCVPLVG